MNASELDIHSYDPADRPHTLSSLCGYFCTALATSKHREFLHPFTYDDFVKFRLFKIHGLNAGFAIKPDGDLVSVHNNSEVRGLAHELLKRAIKSGATKLDHFDGPLDDVFSPFFPVVTEIVPFNDIFAPTGWGFTPLTPTRGHYFENEPDSWERVFRAYDSGRPDVIYRTIAK
jgi:hypothetical protein